MHEIKRKDRTDPPEEVSRAGIHTNVKLYIDRILLILEIGRQPEIQAFTTHVYHHTPSIYI